MVSDEQDAEADEGEGAEDVRRHVAVASAAASSARTIAVLEDVHGSSFRAAAAALGATLYWAERAGQVRMWPSPVTT